MIDLIYFTPEIRCYRDGRVERFYKRKGWKIVENMDNCHGYNRIKVNDTRIRRHRIIGFCFFGLDINNGQDLVDHIDRNKLNNAVNNLRIVTQQENQFNTNAKGYCWDKVNGKWMTYITINGKKIYLGRFDNEADASKAYQDAKLIHHVI